MGGAFVWFFNWTVFSILLRKKGIVKEQYQFSETEFDSLFDENGNFSPSKVEEKTQEKDKN